LHRDAQCWRREPTLYRREGRPYCQRSRTHIVTFATPRSFQISERSRVARCLYLSLRVCLSVTRAGFSHGGYWTYPTVCCNEIGIHVSTKVRVGLFPYGTLSYNSGLRKFRHGQSIVETCYQLSSTKMDAQSVINWTVDNACNGRPLVCHSDPPALSTARFRCAGLSAFRQLW